MVNKSTLMQLAILTLVMSVFAWSQAEDGSNNYDLGNYYGFGPMETLKLDWRILPPIVADINADGLNDIIVVNNRRSRIELLLQKGDYDPCAIFAVEENPEYINDLSSAEAAWRFVRRDYPLDAAATELAVADLNNDTLADLAFIAEEKLHIVYQQANERETAAAEPAEPTWQNAIKIELENLPNTINTLAVGDLNNDDLADLAVKADDAVYILYQNAEHRLDRPINYPTAAQRPRQIEIADIDGNSLADLILLTTDREYPLQVRFQDETGQLGPEVRLQMASPAALALAQLNDTPQSELAAISAQTGRLFISVVDCDTAQQELPVLTYPLPNTENAGIRDTIAADIDGDGLSDIVVSDPSRAEFLVFRAAGDGRLLGPERFPGFKDMSKLIAFAADASGRQGIVALSTEENLIGVTNYANGRLTYPTAIDIVEEPVAFDVADINNNGSADLLYIAKKPQHQQYTLRSVLDFNEETARAGTALAITNLNSNPTDMRIVDINHDGFSDALIVRSYGTMILALQDPNGSGRFTLIDRDDIHDGLVANVFPSTLSIAPLGRDGQSALLLTQRNFARALDFDSELGWQVLDQYHPDAARGNLTASLAYRPDPSSPLNIATIDNARNKLAILTQQEDGTYRQSNEIDIPQIDIQSIQTAQLSHSSTTILLAAADKIVIIPTAGKVCQLRQIADFETDTEEIRLNSLAIADINSDNTADIVMTDRLGHHIEIVTLDASNRLVHATRFKVFEQFQAAGDDYMRQAGDAAEPRAVTLADVTGDGRNDVIVLVHDRIIVYPQD